MLTRKEPYRSFDSSFWRGLIAASFLSVAFAFAIHPAHAHGWHHRHHHYRIAHRCHFHHWRHHSPRHWHRHHAGRAWPRKAYRYEALAAAQSSDILATAERYLGERNPTRFRGPWCKSFVNMIARKTGHFYNRSLRAIDGLHMGIHVRFPRPGDLAVFRHHITIFAGYGGRGFIAIGGNQGHHRVTVSSYPIGRVIAWIRLE